MASKLEENLCCPICHDIFRDPVILSCCHSFCKDCLQTWWTGRVIHDCPMCKRRSSKENPSFNFALKSLCESLLQERDQASLAASKGLCNLHSEKLKLFCLDHQQPVCVVCLHSKKHTNHKFSPIDEAAHQHKTELQEALEPLKKKLKAFEEVKVKFVKTEGHIKVQTRHTWTQIKQQFKKLHQFLEEEEEARMTALREEDEQKNQMMKEKMEALNKEIAALSDTIKATEEELGAEDISFMLNYKAAVERVQQCPLLDDPQLHSGALIDQAKHLGNLTFNIWLNMKEVVTYTPVVLDPNTAGPELKLSEDLTSVRQVHKQQLPDNPERIVGFACVLGSEGLGSGIHSWDIDVGVNTRWELGVFAESVERNGDLTSGLWRLQFCDGKYSAVSPPDTSTHLPEQKAVQIIKVKLKRRKLIFCEAVSKKHIHTFTHAFTGRLFPYIWNGGELPLKISPENVGVLI